MEIKCKKNPHFGLETIKQFYELHMNIPTLIKFPPAFHILPKPMSTHADVFNSFNDLCQLVLVAYLVLLSNNGTHTQKGHNPSLQTKTNTLMPKSNAGKKTQTSEKKQAFI